MNFLLVVILGCSTRLERAIRGGLELDVSKQCFGATSAGQNTPVSSFRFRTRVLRCSMLFIAYSREGRHPRVVTARVHALPYRRTLCYILFGEGIRPQAPTEMERLMTPTVM